MEKLQLEYLTMTSLPFDTPETLKESETQQTGSIILRSFVLNGGNEIKIWIGMLTAVIHVAE